MNNTVLLIIDVQKGFDDPKWGQRNNPEAEENIARLLEAWREKEYTVVHIQHASASDGSPLRPGQKGFEIKDIVQPMEDEPVFVKNVNSAFIGTGLEDFLREWGYEKIVITGLTTNHCVSTTTRMASNLGFETYIVSDATAAFDLTDNNGRHYKAEEIHAVSLANLHEEFAHVKTTEDILREMLS